MTLKQLRIQAGMTGQQLADIAGTTEALISMMESGKRKMSAKTAFRLAPVFSMKWHELMEIVNGVENNDPN